MADRPEVPDSHLDRQAPGHFRTDAQTA